MSYIYKYGYFGFIGVEILINNKGKFLIDVNLKILDFMYLLFLVFYLVVFLNFFVFIVVDICLISIKQLFEEIYKINCEKDGRVIMLLGDEQCGGKLLKVCVVVFVKDVEKVFFLYWELFNLCVLMCNGIEDYNSKI